MRRQRLSVHQLVQLAIHRLLRHILLLTPPSLPHLLRRLKHALSTQRTNPTHVHNPRRRTLFMEQMTAWKHLHLVVSLKRLQTNRTLLSLSTRHFSHPFQQLRFHLLEDDCWNRMTRLTTVTALETRGDVGTAVEERDGYPENHRQLEKGQKHVPEGGVAQSRFTCRV